MTALRWLKRAVWLVSLGALAGAALTGVAGTHSPEKTSQGDGEKLFDEKGCRGCHQLKGQGGQVGPALDDVGLRRNEDSIFAKIKNPKAENPSSIMAPLPGTDAEYRAIAKYLAGLKKEPVEPAAPSGKAEYVGMERCIACHQTQYHTWKDTIHGKLLVSKDLPDDKRACEGCHGPGSLHAVKGDPSLIRRYPPLGARQTNELCLRCHQTAMTKHNFQRTAHSLSKLKCTNCHTIMVERNEHLLTQPEQKLCFTCHATIRGQVNSFSHHPIVEGTMTCTSCHDVHDGKYDGMLKKDVRTLCTGCHADKRGPFKYEHSPNVSGWGGDCVVCHNPHGSPNTGMTVFADRGLCQRCHTDLATHFPEQACYTLGCHHYMHGSNSDDLYFGP